MKPPPACEAPRSEATSPDVLPLLLRPCEVANILRTTPKAIYLRISRGLLPGVVRDGRRVLLYRDDVLRWIEERRATSPGGSR